MALKHSSCAIRVKLRIKMQHNACNFAPVSAFRVRVKQTHIRDKMLLINGQRGIGGRAIGDIWIKRRQLHGAFSQQVCLINSSLGHP